MKLVHLSAIVASLFASSAALDAQTLFFDDFSSGNLSTYTISTAANADRGAVIVNQSSTPANPFSANALRVYDFSATSAIRIQKDYTTSASSNLIQLIQFDVALAAGPTTTGGALIFRLANTGQSLGSGTNSPFDIQLRQNGQLLVYYAGASQGFNNTLNSTGTNLAFYTNSSDASVVLTDLANNELTLGANSFAVYANGSRLGIWGYKSDSTGFSAASGIGTFGFISNTATIDTNVIIDNISVVAIPEASTSAILISIGALLLGVYRIRNKQQ